MTEIARQCPDRAAAEKAKVALRALDEWWVDIAILIVSGLLVARQRLGRGRQSAMIKQCRAISPVRALSVAP
jgi:hypothetical protein